MIEFERFIAELGAEAEKYTREQLHRLHLEVHALAEILLADREAKRAQRTRRRCPQPPVDTAADDRTIRSSITPSDGVGQASQADQP